jgi:hypothetical protein
MRQLGLIAALVTAIPRVAFAGDDGGDPHARGGREEIIGPDDGKADDARAEDDARAAANKGVKLSFRLGVRFLQTAPFSQAYQNVLSAYGFTPMSAIVEAAADAGGSPASWLDVGVHTGYAFGSGGVASGSSGGALMLQSVEVGGFAYGILGRTDRRRPGTFGFGVEGGAMLPFLLLHGDVTSARLPYIAPVVLARLSGDSRIQTAIHVRYLIANWGDAFGPAGAAVGLPLGGFSVSIGANLSL